MSDFYLVMPDPREEEALAALRSPPAADLARYMHGFADRLTTFVCDAVGCARTL